MIYMVKANETVEIAEFPGVKITNTGTSTDSFTVKDNVIEAGLEIFSSWNVAAENGNVLIDLPTVKYA